MKLFIRSKLNPILTPNPLHDWESRQVYNPAVVYCQGKYHLFYRALGVGANWCSVIAYAVSRDGVRFKRFDDPILSPKGPRERRGLEDPRITKMGNKFYMIYTAYDGKTPRLSIATSADLQHWQRKGKVLKYWNFSRAGGASVKFIKGQPRVTQKKGEWSKSGALWPQKIRGRYWILFGDYRLWLANSRDGKNWQADTKSFIGPRDGKYFDNCFVEMGPPPIKTKLGWLVIYHGISRDMYYRLGFLLLDLHNPRKILYRSAKPIFGPEKSYEMAGPVDIMPGGLKSQSIMSELELKKYLAKQKSQKNMPHVAFCCGAVKVGQKLRIYYGAGDGVICTAVAKMSDVLAVCHG